MGPTRCPTWSRKPLSARSCACIPTRPKERLARYSETATLLAELVGQSDATLRGLIDQLQGKDASWNGITFGLETAYYDLLARQTGVGFADVLGGTLNTSIEDYFSISEEQPDRVWGATKGHPNQGWGVQPGA